MSEPRAATISALAKVPGDIVVLGAGGKMGPTLATMARRAMASPAGGVESRRVIAVSRFSSGGAAQALHEQGVETIACDLLDPAAVAGLPNAPNVIYMAGQKFGTHEVPSRTWMLNVVVPAICADHYAGSRIVAFSTGNVYPLVPADGRGARETDTVGPIGEYAASCVGRERVFEHFSASRGTRVSLVRLNYAIDLRYGVLTDLAVKIQTGEPITLAMSSVNVIWQRDANCVALELLARAASPPYVLNVTGTASLSVRDLAVALGERLERTPVFKGRESADALLSDASQMRAGFGEPEMDLETMLDWTAEWVREGRPRLGRPTHFETRDGGF